MPTDKTKNFLKGFGEAAPALAGQLQDAVSRTSRASGDFDISDGEAVEITVSAGTSGSTNNPLDRTPIGAVVVNSDQDAVSASARATDNEVSVEVHAGGTVPITLTLWVF